jgi:hypothetical protein
MKKLFMITLFSLLFSINVYASVKNLTPIADTVLDVNSWAQNTNRGTETWTFLGESNASAYLLKFDLSELTGKTINYAYLKVYETQAGYQHLMYVYPILRTDWVENQATWNIYKTGNNWATAGALGLGTDYTTTNISSTGATNGGYMTWDVTAIVQNMINSGTNTIAIRGLIGSNVAYDYFYTKESSVSPPYLQVSYPAVPGQPTNYYIRPDGGTTTQCNGTFNAPNPDFSGQKNCAFNHPAWALGTPTGEPTVMIAGDILNVGLGKYIIGYGMPNSNCSLDYPYECVMNMPPESDATGNPTKILGEGWDTGCTQRPKFSGTERVNPILTIGDYTQVRCLEITDNSGCMSRHPQGVAGKIDNEPTQNNIVCPEQPYTLDSEHEYAITGLRINYATNSEFHDVSIHGVAGGCVEAYGLSGNTILNNFDIGPCGGGAGWDADDCWSGGSCGTPYTGTVYFINNSSLKWAGCGERAKATPNGELASTPHNCCGQEQGCYSDGMGFDGDAGTWVFSDSEISFNMSDGADLLYSKSGTITFERMKAQGNIGALLKSNCPYTTIENSVLLGDCNTWKKSPWLHASPYAPGRQGTNCNNNGICDANENYNSCTDCRGENYCRAGTAIALNGAGGTNKIYNNTLASTFDILFSLSASDCSGTTVDLKNNIIYGHDDDYSDDWTSWFYQYNSANGNESCPNWVDNKLTEDYNIFYHIKEGSNWWSIKGTHSVYADPGLVGPIYLSRDNPYVGNNYIDNFKPSSASIARDVANKTVGVLSSKDVNNKDRGISWDIGGFESESTSCVPNGSCSAPTPNCGQTTIGVDNCNNSCQKVGQPCPCIPNGSCSASTPACGQTTTGIDNCGISCQKVGSPCPCVPDGSCSAVTPVCGQTTTGKDNCNNPCTKVGQPCPPVITFMTITNFEKWLTTTTIQGADTTPIIKGIRIGSSSSYKYYKVTIEKTIP